MEGSENVAPDDGEKSEKRRKKEIENEEGKGTKEDEWKKAFKDVLTYQEMRRKKVQEMYDELHKQIDEMNERLKRLEDGGNEKKEQKREDGRIEERYRNRNTPKTKRARSEIGRQKWWAQRLERQWWALDPETRYQRYLQSIEWQKVQERKKETQTNTTNTDHIRLTIHETRKKKHVSVARKT